MQWRYFFFFFCLPSITIDTSLFFFKSFNILLSCTSVSVFHNNRRFFLYSWISHSSINFAGTLSKNFLYILLLFNFLQTKKKDFNKYNTAFFLNFVFFRKILQYNIYYRLHDRLLFYFYETNYWNTFNLIYSSSPAKFIRELDLSFGILFHVLSFSCSLNPIKIYLFLLFHKFSYPFTDVIQLYLDYCSNYPNVIIKW